MENELAQAIKAWQSGEKYAQEKLQLVLYDHLRSLASAEKHKMEKKHGKNGLQESIQSTTALVHEVFIKVHQGSTNHLYDTRDFSMTIARAVHNILVDHARKRSALKREGEITDIDNKQNGLVAQHQDDEKLIDLSDALAHMESEFPRQAQTMQLKYFGGLLVKEIADVLAISISSVEKDIAFSKSWLRVRLSQ